MDAAVRDGVPGAVARVRDGRQIWRGTAGVGDRSTGQPRTPRDRFRIASITKTFVSTVLLQLESEGRLDLDDTVEEWLPGVVQGHGNDGAKTTIRQLLNHTSGIFDYIQDEEYAGKLFGKGFLRHRYDTWTPKQLVTLAMKHRPDFAPGAGWKYSNTGYVLAGMVIEKVTGHSYAVAIKQRVIAPLGLHATTVPGTDVTMPQPGSRGYSKLFLDDGPVYDVTELNPSAAGASGSMISDAADLNRFYSALLGGELLPPAQLKDMKTVVPNQSQDPQNGYGLGIEGVRLPCGVVVWGHAGDIHGSHSDGYSTAGGRHSLAVNFNGDWAGDAGRIIEAEFCGV
ncbi:serine hydrolase domain-containing protein [Streptomyces sp. NPDC046925]|uniref:serine hydrolase domain-containing protein n=1 Tax=Streptomyces sp. NPDC046925 TaxID=3155375 RepID=UPI0033E4A747